MTLIAVVVFLGGLAIGGIIAYGWGVESGYDAGVADGWRSAKGGAK